MCNSVQPEMDDLYFTFWECEYCHAQNACIDAECQYCENNVCIICKGEGIAHSEYVPELCGDGNDSPCDYCNGTGVNPKL